MKLNKSQTFSFKSKDVELLENSDKKNVLSPNQEQRPCWKIDFKTTKVTVKLQGLLVGNEDIK